MPAVSCADTVELPGFELKFLLLAAHGYLQRKESLQRPNDFVVAGKTHLHEIEKGWFSRDIFFSNDDL